MASLERVVSPNARTGYSIKELVEGTRLKVLQSRTDWLGRAQIRRAPLLLALVLLSSGAAPRTTAPAGGAPLSQLRQGLAGHSERLQEAREWPERGVAAYMPPGARPRGEEGVFDAVALLAVPLVKTAAFPSGAPAAFFSTHALTDRQLIPRLRRFLAAGGRALITSRLTVRLGGLPGRYADRIFVLSTAGGPRALLALPQTTIDRARNFVLFPLGLRVQAPPRVTLSLYGQRAVRVENYNNYAAGIKMAFQRPVWPALDELQTADGETEVRVASNLAQMQVAPLTGRLLQVVPLGQR
jgi:hypothetical protein